jgi:cytochrome c556
MKKLIQQLGEAIHESVSESEQIAGVVQDIRRHGFDVLLVLEATVGLNELEQQPSAVPTASHSGSKTTGKDEPSVPVDRSGFTSQDLKFLRSLRISMQGEKPTGDQA